MCYVSSDECDANPDGCLFGGTCNNLKNGYSCNCGTNGGDHCQILPDFCTLYPNFCANGVCYNDYNIWSAVCVCHFPYRKGKLLPPPQKKKNPPFAAHFTQVALRLRTLQTPAKPMQYYTLKAEPVRWSICWKKCNSSRYTKEEVDIYHKKKKYALLSNFFRCHWSWHKVKRINTVVFTPSFLKRKKRREEKRRWELL